MAKIVFIGGIELEVTDKVVSDIYQRVTSSQGAKAWQSWKTREKEEVSLLLDLSKVLYFKSDDYEETIKNNKA